MSRNRLSTFEKSGIRPCFPACLLGIFLGIAGCGRTANQGSTPTPVTFEVPVGYAGWTVIEYGVADSVPLTVKDGRRVVQLSPEGMVRTSSALEFGTLDQHFVALGPAGERAGLDNVTLTDRENKAHLQTFDRTIVCCGHHGETIEDGRQRIFEGFYVGKGPAGLPPAWP